MQRDLKRFASAKLDSAALFTAMNLRFTDCFHDLLSTKKMCVHVCVCYFSQLYMYSCLHLLGCALVVAVRQWCCVTLCCVALPCVCIVPWGIPLSSIDFLVSCPDFAEIISSYSLLNAMFLCLFDHSLWFSYEISFIQICYTRKNNLTLHLCLSWFDFILLYSLHWFAPSTDTLCRPLYSTTAVRQKLQITFWTTLNCTLGVRILPAYEYPNSGTQVFFFGLTTPSTRHVWQSCGTQGRGQCLLEIQKLSWSCTKVYGGKC